MKMLPSEIIKAFDNFLAKRGVKVEAIAIGGGALNIAGYTTRATVDVDLLLPKLSAELKSLAEEFRIEMKKKGTELIPNWLNNGPDQFIPHLMKGWEKRTVEIFSGKAIQLKTLSRIELLGTKLIGLGDRFDRDENDIVELKPSKEEMLEAYEWAKSYDANPEWGNHLKKRLKPICRKLGYEF